MSKEKERLSNTRLLAYGFPAAPLSFLWIPIILWIPAYYTQELGLSLTATGLVFLAARLWDGLSDPVVGGLSDRIQTRLGRRKPWMLFGAGFLVVASYFLQVPPATATLSYLAISLICFYTFWTVVQIPHMAWAADLSPDYRERGRIVGFRSFGSMIGILAASMLPVIFLGDDAEPASVLRLYANVLVFLLPIAVIVAIVAVPEPNHPSRTAVTWRDVFSTMAKNKPFRLFLLAFFLWDTALALFEVPMLFVVERSLQLPGAFPKLLAIDYICAIIFTPFTVVMASRFGKHRMFACSGLLFATGCIVIALIPAGNFMLAAVGYAIVGLSISGFWAIPTSMVADAADIGQLSGGGDQTGLYMAAFNLVWKVAMATGVAIGLPLLDVLGFDATAGASNEGLALFSLKIVGNLLPVALLIPAAVILWKYPLTEAKHKRVRQRIEETLD